MTVEKAARILCYSIELLRWFFPHIFMLYNTKWLCSNLYPLPTNDFICCILLPTSNCKKKIKGVGTANLPQYVAVLEKRQSNFVYWLISTKNNIFTLSKFKNEFWKDVNHAHGLRRACVWIGSINSPRVAWFTNSMHFCPNITP